VYNLTSDPEGFLPIFFFLALYKEDLYEEERLMKRLQQIQE